MPIWEVLNLMIAIPDTLKDSVQLTAGIITTGKPSYRLSISDKSGNIPFKPFIEKKMRWGTIFISRLKEAFHLSLENEHYIPAVLSDFLVYLLKNITTHSFLFHSASLVYNNKAYLVPGQADRGKTTLTKHLAEEYVLDDELCALYKDRQIGISLISLPPIPPSDIKQPYKWRGPYPLERLIFLRRSARREISNIASSEADLLLKEEGPFFYTTAQQSSFKRFCSELVSSVPAKKLSYFLGDTLDTEEIFS